MLRISRNILFFQSDSFLSNDFPCRILAQVAFDKISYDYVHCDSASELIAIRRCELNGDYDLIETIHNSRREDKPALVKSVGLPQDPFWEKYYRYIHIEVLQKKFGQNQELRNKLLDLPKFAVYAFEDSDKIDGIGFEPNHQDCEEPAKWPGENRLGEYIAATRQWLLDYYQPFR
jgi:predicted NAD-dependent protein-ADP-ribosyltransferase YbiA (DUF1768 family)